MGVRALCSQKPRHSLALRLAVAAAVDTAGRVRQHELLGQLLLHGGDAAGVLAGENAGDPLRQLQGALFHQLAVADAVDGDGGM